MIIFQSSYPSFRKSQFIIVCGALCLSLAGTANADMEKKYDQLRTCLDISIATEVAKEKPSKDAVLGNCEKEFIRATSRMTPAGKAKIKRTLRAGLEQTLTKPTK